MISKTKPNHVKRFQTRALTTVVCVLLIGAVAAAIDITSPNGDLSSYIQGQIEQALSNQGQITTGSGSGGISLSQSITQSIGSNTGPKCEDPEDEIEYHVDVTCACAKPCDSACDLFKGYFQQNVQIRMKGCDEVISGKLIEVHCKRFLMLEITDNGGGTGGKYNSYPVTPISYLRAVNIDNVLWIDFVL